MLVPPTPQPRCRRVGDAGFEPVNSAVGVVRLRDVLSRLHALSKASTSASSCSTPPRRSPCTTSTTSPVILDGLLVLLVSPPGSTMVSRATCLAQGLPTSALDERGRDDEA